MISFSRALLLLVVLHLTVPPGNCAKIIHTAHHESGSFWVFEKERTRCLSSTPPPPSLYQTCVFLDAPHQLALEYTKMVLGALYFVKPQKILMVGLGGGTLGRALTLLLPDAQIDIVDINPETLPIAQKYFFFSPNDKTQVFIEDGSTFLLAQKDEETYDLILLDVIHDDGTPMSFCTPASFSTPQFVQKVRTLLNKNGIAVFNMIKSCRSHAQELDLYKEVFGTLFQFQNERSQIIIAPKDPSLLPNNLKKSAQQWEACFQSVGVSQEWLLSKFNVLSSIRDSEHERKIHTKRR